MDYRYFLAGSAPNEIPGWFEHTPPEKNISKSPNWEDIKIEEDRDLCENWVNDGCFDLPERLAWFQEAHEKTSKEAAAWNTENQKERYFQWRVYFADNLGRALNN